MIEGMEGILGALNMSEEDMRNIAENAKENPMAAMEAIQDFLTPEIMETIMETMMTDPEGVKRAAEQFGISTEAVDEITEQLGVE